MDPAFSGLDIVLVNLQYGDVEDEIREFKDATGDRGGALALRWIIEKILTAWRFIH